MSNVSTKKYPSEAVLCISGHALAETRANNGICRTCNAAYQREWTANNHERRLKIAREWQRGHRRRNFIAGWEARP